MTPEQVWYMMLGIALDLPVLYAEVWEGNLYVRLEGHPRTKGRQLAVRVSLRQPWWDRW